ncbi:MULTISPECIES: Asp23/Gls24 family envelope stress response protein [unclassified Plantibacter]|jgi:uncharacterized alkaline shock family protein YloU|uniref:Asp23/Gls24 family envelope stress response protein n=1 Tax=unclassified Plantibacter TaxID=2624265 RepID=UPI0007D91BFA|nr:MULTISPECIES: Asp23/Gls24 family envelope stress response protein [unclassified Plantibacter]MBF4563650.1 Asp23/Gls24 family envelope stress response protein [Plantibacter sp. VKM Ac-2876]OAN35324.1 alkaline-shock protein [Plantibacter sp. H53]OII37884.1 alkaline-shock protein [Plantibacter sp. MMLR14_011]
MSNTTNSPKPTVTKGVVGENNAATQTNTHGKTVIDNGVVAKIAGIAAREVRGVHALGGGAARAFGAIRDAIGSSDLSQGIRVEVGETQVAVDVVIVADYPVDLQAVASEVRASVIRAIEQFVGMEVTEVNVTVSDVFIPSDDEDQNAEARVQ